MPVEAEKPKSRQKSNQYNYEILEYYCYDNIDIVNF